MTSANHVRHVNLHTAEEFLNAISPRSKYLEGGLQRFSHYFIFRGHADDRWKLIPKALRLGELLNKPLRGWGRVKHVPSADSRSPTELFFQAATEPSGEPWTNRDQVVSEWMMLRDFFKISDLNGLPLPEDSQLLRDLLDKSLVRNLSEDDTTNWPPKAFLSLLALAQHYGLPTRLLDWTGNSFIAAYFAAVEAARWQQTGDGPEGLKNLGLWAFNGILPKLNRWVDDELKRERIELITAPGASNPNLHAQKGLFTLFRSRGVDRRSLDEIIQSLPSRYELVHFTLPIEEASELLLLLSHQEITGATVYPGYGGAAKALLESSYF